MAVSAHMSASLCVFFLCFHVGPLFFGGEGCCPVVCTLAVHWGSLSPWHSLSLSSCGHGQLVEQGASRTVNAGTVRNSVYFPHVSMRCLHVTLVVLCGLNTFLCLEMAKCWHDAFFASASLYVPLGLSRPVCFLRPHATHASPATLGSRSTLVSPFTTTATLPQQYCFLHGCLCCATRTSLHVP